VLLDLAAITPSAVCRCAWLYTHALLPQARCLNTRCCLCHQGVYGAVTSVAQGPDGTVWVLTRGGRVWDGNTFDDSTHVMVDKSLIPVPVVHQLHPETGAELRRAEGAST
jgi:hypothetical protein